MWFTTVGLWIHWIIEECDFDSLWTWNILEFVLCKLQGDNFNHATALLIFHARQAAKFWPKIVSLSVGFAKAPGHPQGSPQFWRVKAFWPWVPGESRSGYPNWPTDPSGSRTSPPKKKQWFWGVNLDPNKKHTFLPTRCTSGVETSPAENLHHGNHYDERGKEAQRASRKVLDF